MFLSFVDIFDEVSYCCEPEETQIFYIIVEEISTA